MPHGEDTATEEIKKRKLRMNVNVYFWMVIAMLLVFIPGLDLFEKIMT